MTTSASQRLEHPVRVLVLVPRRPGRMRSPEALPLGRAAIRLAREGIEVVFGDATRPGGEVDGYIVCDGAWEWRESVSVEAVYNRFPSKGRPVAFGTAMGHVGHLPMGNSSAFTALCADKVASQAAL